jgi:hypothetical protein
MRIIPVRRGYWFQNRYATYHPNQG